ncbi:cupin domain-containing protein [Microbacterium sp.]|uniref:cupin domain-containing protein n=1 Tax=Microbacterium sp. TaxID=51671 RepID=UPI003A8682D3
MAGYDILEMGSTETWGGYTGVAPGKRFVDKEMPAQYIGMSANSLAPGGSAPFWHTHFAVEEMYVFLTGTGQMALDDEIVDVSPGTAVRVGQGVWRAWHAASDGPLTWLCIRSGGAELAEVGLDGERDLERPLPWT